MATTSFSTLEMDGCGLTTPSSVITPIESGLVWLSIYMPERQGRGQHFGSNCHGVAPMTAFVTDTRDSKLRLIGPMTEGTCSWPSVDTDTPRYGRRVLCVIQD